MGLVIVNTPVPLKTDLDGVVRVGDTRVTLDTVIAAFKEGATAEEIVSQYPSLSLAEVYAVIGYYLQRQAEVEAYLDQRQQISEEVRQQNEARFNQQGIRERLLARHHKLERPRLTARQLLNSELIGLWKDRTDITDSASYARQLREQAQKRPGISGAGNDHSR